MSDRALNSNTDVLLDLAMTLFSVFWICLSQSQQQYQSFLDYDAISLIQDTGLTRETNSHIISVFSLLLYIQSHPSL
jgi:hypothetical protein